MPELATYQLDGGVATIRMDDGKVNVVSLAMIESLNQQLDRAAADNAAVLLAGRDGTFSAGFDRNILLAGSDGALEMLIGGFQLAERLFAYPRPVITACTGHALAMGSFLLLAADYRIGARGAFKIGANEVAIGMILPSFPLELCKLRLAPTHLQRSVINAEIYDPDGAVPAGFLDRVVEGGELHASARRVAEGLAKHPAAAFAETKQRLRAEWLTRLQMAIELDRSAFGKR